MKSIRPEGQQSFERQSRVRPLRVLVWQWGRRGAGPRFAVALAGGLRRAGGIEVDLSLSSRAEILDAPERPGCELPVRTYGGVVGLLGRMLTSPVLVVQLWRWLRVRRPDVAICAMAGPLDLVMAAVLAGTGIPYALIVHEAVAHPGDRWRVQYRLQRWLARHASVLVALTRHVANQMAAQVDGRRVIVAEHPPFALEGGDRGVAPRVDGKLRVLLFGRLLRYKGLDLLADALTLLRDRTDLEVRVVGQGPEAPELDRLRGLPSVRVENRWVAERELGELFGWPDVVVLSHREASQSGVAAAAIGAGRRIIATRVGGLPEQLAGTASAVLCEPEAPALAEALAKMADSVGCVSVCVADIAQQWESLGCRIAWALETRSSDRSSLKKNFASFSKRSAY